MIKKILSVLLVIIWSLFIFTNSNQNGESSTGNSNKLISKVVSILTNVEEGTKEMDEIVEKFNLPVRKTAHFIEYFLLAVFVVYALLILNVPSYLIIAIIYSVLFAISDEVHQLFIDGRSGQLSDVLLDSSGALIGVYITNLLIVKKKK